MKRILILSLLSFLLLFSYTVLAEPNENTYLNFSKDEIQYIKENNIDLDNLINYYHYESFNLYKYFEYEEIRKKTNNYLESLNIINHPNYYSDYNNVDEAPFLNSSSILINKHFYVLKDYVPNNLVPISNYNIKYIRRENEIMQGVDIALEHLEQMFDAARYENIELYVFSGYRNYTKQEYLYYVVNQQNDNYSARPGHSEHHSGLAFDISTLNNGLLTSFSNSVEYQWLINNCYKYGFILRYPKDKENITLYKFEPWHFRFVGKEIAYQIFQNNLTFEEYILKNYELN